MQNILVNLCSFLKYEHQEYVTFAIPMRLQEYVEELLKPHPCALTMAYSLLTTRNNKEI